MNKFGYIKLPRSISVLKGSKRWLLAHICSEAAYCTTEHPACGKIERGELVTSRNQLAEDVGLTPMQVRHALESLESLGYITVEAAARYTKIAITWPDFVQLRDSDIMLNNQSSNQVNNQTSNQMATSASVEDSARYSDSAERHAQSVTKAVTQSVTQSVTNNSINNKENNNTHTSSIYPVRDLKSAPARECAPVCAYDALQRAFTPEAPSPVVSELQEWIMRNVPDFYAMPQPVTAPQLRRMIERYPMADIQRLLITAWSKGACASHRVAYAAFRSFADNDRILLARTREDKPAEELYTYDQMCDFVWKNRVQQEKYFQPVKHNGKTMFQKIC